MAEKGRLGAGLSALLGEAAFEETSADFLFLPISKVESAPNQPRKHFDEVELQELADSIAEHGIIQPLTVRKLANGYYQIIAGERRWRAARLAGLEEVPVRIIEADDRRAMELALVENLQRADLNAMETAEGYRSLMEEFGFTQEEAAQRVGVSRPAVANMLRLLSLPPEAAELLRKGELSAGHARAVLMLPDSASREEFAKLIVRQGLSVRDAEKMAAKLAKAAEKPQEEPKIQQKTPVDYAAEVERELTGLLGRRVKLVDGKKKGRFEIDFYGEDDREALIDALRALGNK